MEQSISMSQGKVAKEHDERNHTPKNTDERLKDLNKIIKKTPESYHDAFNNLFESSMNAYNEQQIKKGRFSRMKYDYYDEIMSDKRKERAVYEYVVQIGNHNTNGVTTNDFDFKAWKKDHESVDIKQFLNTSDEQERCNRALDATMARLEDEFPALHFWTIIKHGDEPCGTPHYHIAFTPVADGYTSGMPVRCGLNKALASMGYKRKGKLTPTMQMQNRLKDMLEEEMQKEGISRDYRDNHDKRLSVDLYKLEKEIEELTEKRDKLKSNSRELTRIVSNKMLKYKELSLSADDFEIECQIQNHSIEELNRNKATLTDDVTRLTKDKSDLSDEISGLRKKKDGLQAELDSVDVKYRRKKKNYDELTAVYDELEGFQDYYKGVQRKINNDMFNWSLDIQNAMKEALRGSEEYSESELEEFCKSRESSEGLTIWDVFSDFKAKKAVTKARETAYSNNPVPTLPPDAVKPERRKLPKIGEELLAMIEQSNDDGFELGE